MFQRLIALFAVTLFLAACETASQTTGVSSGDSSSSTTTTAASTTASSADSSGTTSASGSSDSSGSSAASTESSSVTSTRTPAEKLTAIGNSVYFGFDSSALDQRAQQTLSRQAAFLKMYPSIRITIEGHCDERGTREYNLALGERRASAAQDFLLAQGIDAARIRIVSYGKERPAVEGSTESSWAKNRRSSTIIN